MQTNPQLFNEHYHARRTSEASILSTVSGIGDTLPIQAINKCKLLKLNLEQYKLKHNLMYATCFSDKKVVGF